MVALLLFRGEVGILGPDRHQPLLEACVGLLFQNFVEGLVGRLGVLGKMVGVEI